MYLNKISKKVLGCIFLAAIYFPCLSQRLIDSFPAIPLEVTHNKTSTIVFLSNIISVDRGSQDVIAQKVEGTENILQVKAALNKGFPETNLTVITSDGEVHHFTVQYSEHPKQLTGKVCKDSSVTKLNGATLKVGMNQAIMDAYAKEILKNKRSKKITREKKYKIGLSLEGIYVYQDILLYHINVNNMSNINYDIDIMRFYIKDGKKMKRTASQEIEVRPIFYSRQDQNKITSREGSNIIIAFEKFTIPETKLFFIEMFEKNGGRNLSITVKNRAIVKAKDLRENSNLK